MYPKIIGLLGRSRVGKDTVADYILTYYNDYQIERLAAPIKKAVCELYGYTSHQIESNAKEEIDIRWGITPRQSMQSLTKYMMSEMGLYFFTKRLFDKYDLDTIPKNIIIPDIRYLHDIQEIQKRNGIVIKIERPNNNIHHECENNIDNFTADFTIINNGSITELQNKVKFILDKYFTKNN